MASGHLTRRGLLGHSFGIATAVAITAPVVIPAITRGPTPEEEVDRLMVELRDALAALGTGPMRAIIDSDRDEPGVVSSLAGRPFVGGRRLGGVPVSMLRFED